MQDRSMQDSLDKPARRTFLKAGAVAAAGLATASSAKETFSVPMIGSRF